MTGLDLQALVGRLAQRSADRSEATIQSDIRTLILAAPLNLTEHGVESISLESPAGERRRIDIEAGFTVIEVKRDLRTGNVKDEAVGQLAGYVKQRTQLLGQRYVGVLTDGADWLLYHLTPDGELAQIGEVFSLTDSPEGRNELFVWLESVLATGQQIAPTPIEIEGRLGANSPSHRLDFSDLTALYELHKDQPSVALKRELWSKLLRTALGSTFEDDDALFVEHTLLVATAEVIAHAVIGFVPTQLAPATLLSGALFEDAQIGGVVEEDFFDWLTEVEGGEAFVRSLARRLSRFDWSSVEHDVMKVLYESVIGRAERYNLGEYYTPDWLAERVVAASVHDPLNERVVDPACGSGTFLFHAVRHYLKAADVAGVPNGDAIRGATEHVLGLDIHPLAVTFARVTYLLGIGMARIGAPDRGAFNIPVYLGDSLQWGQQQTLLSDGALAVSTGDGSQLFANELRFPDSLLADAGRFDQLVAELADKAAKRLPGTAIPPLTATFRRFPVSESEKAVVTETFRTMCELHDQGRDHIWGYYVRNLARPKWLARQANRVDVLVGNPPWLTYNAIATDLKDEFRTACEERHLWSGGSARNHDLCALFVVRAIELYLKPGGAFGFVMPLATLSRRQFDGFRGGDYPATARPTTVRFEPSWDLDAVRPHPFPVPSAVVFGQRVPQEDRRSLPPEVSNWSGTLPARNVDWSTAAPLLTENPGVTLVASGEHKSPYAKRFESGAKLSPQVLVLVEPAPAGPLGLPSGFQAVRSRRSSQEKSPWKDLPSLSGSIEAEFVRAVHLGSTVLPYRTLDPLLAVVPWDKTAKRLLSDDDERLDLYPKLAEWWRKAAALWSEHGTPDRYDLTARIDFQSKLSRQLPATDHRIVYTKSGTHLAAARLRDTALVQEMLYWATANSAEEALYLCAILNSQTVGERVAPYQNRGQFGARHFDLYVWYLSIPEYDSGNANHVEMAALAKRAEAVAAGIDLSGTSNFQVARKLVREAVSADGVGQEIEHAVTALLPPA